MRGGQAARELMTAVQSRLPVCRYLQILVDTRRYCRYRIYLEPVGVGLHVGEARGEEDVAVVDPGRVRVARRAAAQVLPEQCGDS